MKTMRHYLDWIATACREYPNSIAIRDFQCDDIVYTYSSMEREVGKIKTLLQQLGVNPGDKVAICGRSCSRWAMSFLSVAATRAVIVSILPDFTGDNINYLVNHSGAKVVFAGNGIAAKLEGEKTAAHIIDMEEDIPEWHDCKPAENIWELGDIDDLVLINYTSGTTDKPKGVMITNRNLSSNVNFSQGRIPNHPGDRIVSVLPLAHIFGLMFDFLYQLAGGAEVVFMKRKVNPTLLMTALQEVRPYMMLTVPLVIEKVINTKVMPKINRWWMKMLWYTPFISRTVRKKVKDAMIKSFGGNLRFLIIGGAAMNGKVEKVLEQIQFPYTEGYGMTECTPLVSYEDWWKYKRGTVGRPVDGVKVRVDSPKPWRIAGELLVKGDSVFIGYYNNEAANKAAFTEDGWFRTGDMCVIRRDGFIRLRGRCKNMILGPTGQNIYPEEIEAKLNVLDKVAESLVVERAGKLIALVYPNSNVDKELLTEIMAEYVTRVNKELPNYSHLSGIEIMEEEFEKTPKNSIKRFLYK